MDQIDYGWRVTDIGEMVITVIPENDVYPHNQGDEPCHCHPRVELYPGGGKVIIHSSFDGREVEEIDQSQRWHL